VLIKCCHDFYCQEKESGSFLMLILGFL